MKLLLNRTDCTSVNYGVVVRNKEWFSLGFMVFFPTLGPTCLTHKISFYRELILGYCQETKLANQAGQKPDMQIKPAVLVKQHF
jgi:hypothetical protein